MKQPRLTFLKNLILTFCQSLKAYLLLDSKYYFSIDKTYESSSHIIVPVLVESVIKDISPKDSLGMKVLTFSLIFTHNYLNMMSFKRTHNTTHNIAISSIPISNYFWRSH